jgi:hypothetical protein
VGEPERHLAEDKAISEAPRERLCGDNRHDAFRKGITLRNSSRNIRPFR